MNQQQVVRWFEQWAHQCIAEKDYINYLDQGIGDGDHGSNMAKGLSAWLQQRPVTEIATLAEEFRFFGMTLMESVGGAAGPIYGSAFLDMAKQLDGVTEFDDVQLVALLRQALSAIQGLGKAELNEKTLVDLWSAVIADLQAGQLTAARIDACIQATGAMKATKGRAAYLGERSIGHIDPGSYSSALLFKALLAVK